jgi:hypothetical protein
MKTFTEIKAMCSSNEDLKRVLYKHLNLIRVVNENYEHIQDLEVLISLLRGGLSSYYKEFHPQQEEIVQFCAIVAENTRANHYREIEKFDDVYTILAELKESL